jgi:hypothetical protein
MEIQLLQILQLRSNKGRGNGYDAIPMPLLLAFQAQIM